MTVAELKKMLEQYPDNMEVITTRCSDYDKVELDEWAVVKVVPKDHWFMRSHPTMSSENKKLEQECLHLSGN